MASWCPKSWYGAVPEDVRDRFGNLPQSTEEAGQAIYLCMRSGLGDVAHYSRRDDGIDKEIAVHFLMKNGWHRNFLPLRTIFNEKYNGR